MNNDDLVDKVAEHNFTLQWKSPRDMRVLEAMRKVDRANFVHRQDRLSIFELCAARSYNIPIIDLLHLLVAEIPYLDMPLSIGYNQTCSQPSLVGFMMDILNLREGMKVLEIGTGCGYQAAILKKLVGKEGRVISLEYHPTLAQMARDNLKGTEVAVFQGDGSLGLCPFAPYDAIVLCAEVSEKFNPDILGIQVPEGVLLYPRSDGLLMREKYRDGLLQQCDGYGKVKFVPMLGENC